jgi:hypothetical protein
MDDGDETFHALEITPEALVRILTEEISEKYDAHKNKNRLGDVIPLGTEFWIRKGEEKPKREQDFYKNTKREAFASNKWK